MKACALSISKLYVIRINTVSLKGTSFCGNLAEPKSRPSKRFIERPKLLSARVLLIICSNHLLELSKIQHVSKHKANQSILA